MKLTERNIAVALHNFFIEGSVVTHNNVHVFGFESDFIRVTKSGYSSEFEIKLSVSDFNADAKKGSVGNTKHDQLQAGKLANSFYFVMPQEIADKVVIPGWAGYC